MSVEVSFASDALTEAVMKPALDRRIVEVTDVDGLVARIEFRGFCRATETGNLALWGLKVTPEDEAILTDIWWIEYGSVARLEIQ